MTSKRKVHRTGKRSLLAVAAGAVLLVMAGCDGLLDVDLPGDLTEDDLFQAESATVLVNSAVGDYENCWSMFSVMTAAFEDVWVRTTGYWGDWAEYRAKRGAAGACGATDFGTAWYGGLQSARWVAEQAYEHLQEWSPADITGDRDQLMATSATYAGLVYQLAGEVFCEWTANVSAIMSPEETLQEAETWFNRALQATQAAGDFSYISTGSMAQLAHLGRARVRMALGDYSGAASDAEQVQPGFVAYVTRDASVQPRWNHIYRGTNVMLMGSIANEGPNGTWQWEGQTVSLGYRALALDPEGRQVVGEIGVGSEPQDRTRQPLPSGWTWDTRVPVEFAGEFAADGVTDMWQQTKYGGLGDDQIMAKWAEAILILAEVEARNGNVEGSVALINELRDAQGLPRITYSVTLVKPIDAPRIEHDANDLMDVIYEERRREFFYEGRHWADKIRLDGWFPRMVGQNHKNVAYGDVHCIMMPESEYQNNPNIPEGYLGPY